MAKKSEYGKPTYARAVLAKFGVGDGWGNPKKVATPYTPPQDRMNVANAPEKLGGVINKRKKMLDDL